MIDYSRPFKYEGKVTLITGAGGSIGQEAARAFAQCGANIVAADIDLKAADATLYAVKQYGGDNMSVAVDLSSVKDIYSMVDKVIARYGRIDFLLNHAGINIRKDIVDITEEDYDKVADIDLKAVYFAGQAVGRQMLKQGYGKIVNTASVSGVRAKKKLSVYAAAKSGVVHLTRAMAHEWAASGLNINAVGPGYVKTQQTESLFADKVKYNELMSKIPQGRFGEAEDMAAVMLFLCSPLASYINGQTIYVDGGRMVD